MPTWLRSVFGVLTGGLNLFAHGTNWKEVLLSVAVAGLGIVTHLTSTSNLPVVPISGAPGVLSHRQAG